MALTPDAWQTFLKLEAKNKKEIGTNGREAATAAKLRRVDAGAKKNPRVADVAPLIGWK